MVVSPRLVAQQLSPRGMASTSMGFVPADHRGLDDLMSAMQQQKARGARKFQQLRRQAESQAEERGYWEEKAQRRQERSQQRDQELEAERRARAERAAEVERRRHERLEAAERNEGEFRASARAGVHAKDVKAEKLQQQRAVTHIENVEEAAANAARRRAASDREKALLQERRGAAEHREQLVTETLRRHEQQRLAARQAQHEEDAERDLHRQETKARADGDQAGRVHFYRERVTEKERLLEERKQELEQLRQLKADEARQRAESIALQARSAAERDADARAALQARIGDKMQRADALARQREQLVEEMRRVRHQMHHQEQVVRTSMSMVRRTGNFDLPPEVLESLEAFSPAAQSSLYLTSPSHRPRSQSTTAYRGGHSRLTMSAQGKLGGDAATQRILRMGMATAHVTVRRRPSSAGAATTRSKHGELWGAEYDRYSNVVVVPSPDSRREAALRALLSREIAKESERQEAGAAVKDDREKARLQIIFAAERELAKKKILELSSAAEVPLQ